MAIKKDFYIAVHPGEVLQDILNESGITQVQLAKHLKIQQSKINEICRKKRGISPLMSAKLAQAFDQNPKFWLDVQHEWELSQIDKKKYSTIKKIKLQGSKAA